jgi:tetratricopeptide (TPR) repeat protein
MKAFTSIILLTFAVSLFAQSQPGTNVTAEMRAEANAFYQDSNWTKAAEAYKKILEIEPANAGANYRLGLCFLGLNRNSDARNYFEAAFTASPNAVFALGLARSYARLGDKTRAFETLEKSTKHVGIAPEKLR